MRNTLIGLVVAGALVALPLAASAQSTDIQSQIASLLAQIKVLQQKIADLVAQAQTGTSGTGTAISSVTATVSPSTVAGGWCTIARTLFVGSSGQDVMNLQTFLQNEGVFNAQPTGYFGSITAGAVAKWQASQGLDSVGIVGPLTRERILGRCGGTVTTSALMASPVSGQAPLSVNFWYLLGGDSADGYSINFGDGTTGTPTIGCGGAPNSMMAACPRALVASHVYASDGAYTATLMQSACGGNLQCLSPIKLIGSVQISVGTISGNKPPAISSFTGPTTLAVGQTGTWSVQASDPENGSLSYRVIWGDETNAASPTGYGAAAMTNAFVQSTTFTHSYAFAGTYTVQVTVLDSLGASATVSATVQVGGGGAACTTEYAPVCGRPSGCANTCTAGPGYACPMMSGVSSMVCMLPNPQTYPNTCAMNAAGATLLYQGACTNTTGGQGTLSGTLSIGPICPVETYPPSPQCSPSAATYAAHQIYITSGAGVTTAITANLDGTFSTALAPGDYTLTVENASCTASSANSYNCSGISSSGGTPIPVRIPSGGTTSIAINVDTGIR